MTTGAIDTAGLLPCPFCGGQAYVQNAGWAANTFVRCRDCKTEFSLDNGSPRAHGDTVAAWNRRASLEATRSTHEPVAWEQRQRKRDEDAEWGDWYPSSAEAFAEFTGNTDHEGRYFWGSAHTEYQVRALYDALPTQQGFREGVETDDPNDHHCAWRELEGETQEALQAIGEEFGILAGEPRVAGVLRILTEQRQTIRALSEQPADPAPSTASGVPDGWKLVPIEPTDAMCAEAAAKALHVTSDAHRRVLADGYACVYRDMLAASPVPKPEGGGE